MIALKNRLPVIVMTGHGDIPMAIRAMKSGALDFILKPLNDQQLIEQIQKALVQNSASSMILYDQVKENFSTLSTREKEIMILVTEGKLNKQIAYDLNIGLSTVELYRARVMKKMQAKNIIQLVEMKMALKS